MKIVFFGSSDFALPSLKALINAGLRPVCVVTQPDRQKGRGLRDAGTSVKQEAVVSGLNVFQPEDVNSAISLSFLKGLQSDLFVVVAYGQKLSQEILDIPRIMPVNLHPSLLPKYRGAAPINWALINGETVSGVSLMKMVRRMDAGPVIQRLEVPISSDDDAVSLGKRLSELGARILAQSLCGGILNLTCDLAPQQEEEVSYARLLKKSDGRIDWRLPAEKIVNLVRGCSGWPEAFSCYRGGSLKIKKAALLCACGSSGKPGEIICASDDRLHVSCSQGSLAIEKIQPESKREMSAEEFIRGYRPLPGECFENIGE